MGRCHALPPLIYGRVSQQDMTQPNSLVIKLPMGVTLCTTLRDIPRSARAVLINRVCPPINAQDVHRANRDFVQRVADKGGEISAANLLAADDAFIVVSASGIGWSLPL